MHVQPTCCVQAVSGCGFAEELPATDPSAGVGMCCTALHSSVVYPGPVGPPNWACGLLQIHCSKHTSRLHGWRCHCASFDEPHGPSRLLVQPAGGWWCWVWIGNGCGHAVSGLGRRVATVTPPTCRPCTGSGVGQLSCHASHCWSTWASASCLLAR
jgi:hypothetical protein